MENQVNPRENRSLIVDQDWIDGHQAARIKGSEQSNTKSMSKG
jgi:hypothetical protein